MIVSHSKKFLCLNPPKTGSGYRELILHEYTDISIDKSRQNLCEKVKRHATLNDAIVLFQANEWNIDEYYKFAFVRNPWERLVSHFNMAVQQCDTLQLNAENFHNFLKEATYHPDHKQEAYFLRENKVFLNYVGCMETHEDDIKIIFNEIGLSIPKAVQINQDNKRYHSIINQFWTKESIEMVKDFDIKTIKLKNYKKD